MNRNDFVSIAKQFRAGRININQFADQVLAGDGNAAPAEVAPVPQAKSESVRIEFDLDLDRRQRCGFPEVVWGDHKSPRTLVQIAQKLLDADQAVFVTRVEDASGRILSSHFPDGVYNALANTFRIGQNPKLAGSVAIVTAGTGDLAVAGEAAETLRWCGAAVDMIADVGVAGPHRLVEKLDQIQGRDCLIVVAGCEGALPSVVAGHVDCPVIAVPTSVGYGASLGGVAALLSMLNSCAANVAVVNIDAGFKAGYLAGLLLRKISLKTDR